MMNQSYHAGSAQPWAKRTRKLRHFMCLSCNKTLQREQLSWSSAFANHLGWCRESCCVEQFQWYFFPSSPFPQADMLVLRGSTEKMILKLARRGYRNLGHRLQRGNNILEFMSQEVDKVEFLESDVRFSQQIRVHHFAENNQFNTDW